MPSYVVLQVVLKEKFIGKGSQNLSELENTINSSVLKVIDYTLFPLQTVVVKVSVVAIESKLL